MTTTTNTQYNGWTNYETWLVNLWLTNDQGSQEMAQEWAQEYVQDAIDKDCNSDSIKNDAAYELGQRLKDLHDEMSPEVTGLFADLINAALGSVNWYEIGQHFVDEIDIYSAGWNMPGYMPDMTPSLFTDADAAMEFIKEEMLNDAENNAPVEHSGSLVEQAQAFKQDAKGEFGAGFMAYHYFISKV